MGFVVVVMFFFLSFGFWFRFFDRNRLEFLLFGLYNDGVCLRDDSCVVDLFDGAVKSGFELDASSGVVDPALNNFSSISTVLLYC